MRSPLRNSGSCLDAKMETFEAGYSDGLRVSTNRRKSEYVIWYNRHRNSNLMGIFQDRSKLESWRCEQLCMFSGYFSCLGGPVLKTPLQYHRTIFSGLCSKWARSFDPFSHNKCNTKGSLPYHCVNRIDVPEEAPFRLHRKYIPSWEGFD